MFVNYALLYIYFRPYLSCSFDILQDPVLKRHKSTTWELFFPDDSKFFLPFNQKSPYYSADVLGSNVYGFFLVLMEYVTRM